MRHLSNDAAESLKALYEAHTRKQSSPPVPFIAATELQSRRLAYEGWHGGMVLTEAGEEVARKLLA